MTKQELSLLLYLETCAVDHSGRVSQEKLNDEEREIIKAWTKSGYIAFGRICIKSIVERTHWVLLSMDATRDAHAERALRAARSWANKNYQTTEEKRAA